MPDRKSTAFDHHTRTGIHRVHHLSRPSPMSTHARTIGRRGLVLIAVAIAFVLVVASAMPVVTAHAYFSDSDPAPESHVEDVPETITMWFDGDGVDEIIDVTVTGPDGEDVTREAYKDGDVSDEVFVDVDDGGDGIYIVSWVIRATDTHITSGEWFFTAGEDPPDPQTVRELYDEDDEDDEDIEYAQIVPTGLLYLSVVALIGIPAMVLSVIRPVRRRYDRSGNDGDDHVSRLLIGAGVLALVSTVVLFFEAVISSGGSVDAVEGVLGTRLGTVLSGQALAALAVVGAALAVRRAHLSQVTGLAVAATAGVIVAFGLGWTSHAASIASTGPATVVTVAHVAGAGVWIGGLAVLALFLPGLLREYTPERRRAVATAVIRRYSILAIAGVTVLVATGLALVAWLVPDPGSFTETLHGRILGTKLLLVVLALGLGAFSRFVLLARLDPTTDDRSRFGSLVIGRFERHRTDGGSTGRDPIGAVVRTVRIEVVIVVCIVLLSGVLTATAPGIMAGGGGEEGIDATPVDVELQTLGDTDDLEATMTVMPAETVPDGSELMIPAENPVVVELTLSRDGDPIEFDEREQLVVSHAESGTSFNPDLEALEESGTYGTVLLVPEVGTWTVDILSQADGTFVDDRVVLESQHEDAGDDHDDHSHDDHSDEGGGTFVSAVWITAVLVGLGGAGVLTREILSVSS